MFKTKKYFVVATEIITGLAFALVALSLPLPDFFRYAIALMGIIALSGATHDIAGDGVYLTELTATQQAKYIGWQGAFYNLAKILANGGLVWLAGMLKESIWSGTCLDDCDVDVCGYYDFDRALPHSDSAFGRRCFR